MTSNVDEETRSRTTELTMKRVWRSCHSGRYQPWRRRSMNGCHRWNRSRQLLRRYSREFLSTDRWPLLWSQRRCPRISPRKGKALPRSMTKTKITHSLAQTSGEINDGDVRGGNTESHSGEFPVQIRDHFSDLLEREQRSTNGWFSSRLHSQLSRHPLTMEWCSGQHHVHLANPKSTALLFSRSPMFFSLRTLLDGPSTVFCVAVYECTVVINASTMPNFSCTTLAKGAKQLVVHEALEMTLSLPVYLSSFTPMTNIGASAEGAVMITFFAPAWMCGWHLSIVVNTPVDSTTYSAPEGKRRSPFVRHHRPASSEIRTDFAPGNLRWFFPKSPERTQVRREKVNEYGKIYSV